MQRRKLVVPEEAATITRSLHPAAKRKIRAALDEIREDPAIGDELRDELAGLRRVRVGRFRVVYRRVRREVQVIAVGPRGVIYEDLAARTRDARHPLEPRP